MRFVGRGVGRQRRSNMHEGCRAHWGVHAMMAVSALVTLLPIVLPACLRRRRPTAQGHHRHAGTPWLRQLGAEAHLLGRCAPPLPHPLPAQPSGHCTVMAFSCWCRSSSRVHLLEPWAAVRLTLPPAPQRRS